MTRISPPTATPTTRPVDRAIPSGDRTVLGGDRIILGGDIDGVNVVGRGEGEGEVEGLHVSVACRKE